jgi:hypothetical protein
MFATSEPNPCEYWELVLYVGASCDRKERGVFAADADETETACAGGTFPAPASFSFSLLFLRAAAYSYS